VFSIPGSITVTNSNKNTANIDVYRLKITIPVCPTAKSTYNITTKRTTAQSIVLILLPDISGRLHNDWHKQTMIDSQMTVAIAKPTAWVFPLKVKSSHAHATTAVVVIYPIPMPWALRDY